MGGVERYVAHLARGLQARGIPVEIVTTEPATDHPYLESCDGIPVRRFPTLRGDRLFYPSPLLARWLGHNGGRYSLFHAHNLHTLVPLACEWAARQNRIPFILTAHWHGTGHTPVRRLLHVPYRPVADWVVHGSRSVIGNSDAEAALLRRDFGDRLPITVIPEGISLATPAVADPIGGGVDHSNGVTILSVGRLEPYKRVQRLVEAVAVLPEPYQVVVVGDGPARSAIERAAVTSGVHDQVRLLGRVPDDELRGWYARADAFVSLSMHESFGLAVLEAAAAGMPVVASDIPAHRESLAFVPHGRIILVPTNAPAVAVAAAIQVALAAGRAVDRSDWPLPSWDGLVDQTVDVYRSVLGRH